MIVKNIKGFRKASYYCLILLSAVLPSTTEGKGSLLRDYIDHPVVGGSIIVPRQKESFIDFLEKKIRLLFEDYDTNEDEVQKEVQFPPMDTHRQEYDALKNRIIDKYKGQKPELARFKTSSKQELKKPKSTTEDDNFVDLTRKLREKAEEDYKDLQKFQELAMNTTASLLEAAIDNKVKSPRLKRLY